MTFPGSSGGAANGIIIVGLHVQTDTAKTTLDASIRSRRLFRLPIPTSK